MPLGCQALRYLVEVRLENKLWCTSGAIHFASVVEASWKSPHCILNALRSSTKVNSLSQRKTSGGIWRPIISYSRKPRMVLNTRQKKARPIQRLCEAEFQEGDTKPLIPSLPKGVAPGTANLSFLHLLEMANLSLLHLLKKASFCILYLLEAWSILYYRYPETPALQLDDSPPCHRGRSAQERLKLPIQPCDRGSSNMDGSG